MQDKRMFLVEYLNDTSFPVIIILRQIICMYKSFVHEFLLDTFTAYGAINMGVIFKQKNEKKTGLQEHINSAI